MLERTRGNELFICRSKIKRDSRGRNGKPIIYGL